MAEVHIDWTTANVHEGELAVALSEPGSPKWRTRAMTAIAALTRSGHAWGKVTVKKGGIVVAGVPEGREGDLRHFLESVVLQANAAGRPPVTDPANDADRRMTDAFREFGDGDYGPGADHP